MVFERFFRSVGICLASQRWTYAGEYVSYIECTYNIGASHSGFQPKASR